MANLLDLGHASTSESVDQTDRESPVSSVILSPHQSRATGHNTSLGELPSPPAPSATGHNTGQGKLPPRHHQEEIAMNKSWTIQTETDTQIQNRSVPSGSQSISQSQHIQTNKKKTMTIAEYVARRNSMDISDSYAPIGAIPYNNTTNIQTIYDPSGSNTRSSFDQIYPGPSGSQTRAPIDQSYLGPSGSQQTQAGPSGSSSDKTCTPCGPDQKPHIDQN